MNRITVITLFVLFSLLAILFKPTTVAAAPTPCISVISASNGSATPSVRVTITVKDSTGAPISGAGVSATYATGSTKTATTNASGVAVINFGPFGGDISGANVSTSVTANAAASAGGPVNSAVGGGLVNGPCPPVPTPGGSTGGGFGGGPAMYASLIAMILAWGALRVMRHRSTGASLRYYGN